jgi:hypothetical protein
MSGFMVRSTLGIHFTSNSMEKLRESVENASKRSLVLFLNVAPDKEGRPNVDFCYDFKTGNPGIPDQLQDVVFNWSTNQRTLDILRKGYCVDSEAGRKTRVIPLANVKDE